MEAFAFLSSEKKKEEEEKNSGSCRGGNRLRWHTVPLREQEEERRVNLWPGSSAAPNRDVRSVIYCRRQDTGYR